MAKQVRQGDVLIHPESIPDGARKQRLGKRLVLAEGEATGHAHAIAKPKETLEARTHEGQLYLKVMSPTEVVHEEHGTVTLEPGEYVVRRQVEVWLDEARQVAD